MKKSAYNSPSLSSMPSCFQLKSKNTNSYPFLMTLFAQPTLLLLLPQFFLCSPVSNDSSHPPNIQFFLIQDLITSRDIHALFCFSFHMDFHFLTLLNDERGMKVWWWGRKLDRKGERGCFYWCVVEVVWMTRERGRCGGVVVCLL